MLLLTARFYGAIFNVALYTLKCGPLIFRTVTKPSKLLSMFRRERECASGKGKSTRKIAVSDVVTEADREGERAMRDLITAR